MGLQILGVPSAPPREYRAALFLSLCASIKAQKELAMLECGACINVLHLGT